MSCRNVELGSLGGRAAPSSAVCASALPPPLCELRRPRGVSCRNVEFGTLGGQFGVGAQGGEEPRRGLEQIHSFCELGRRGLGGRRGHSARAAAARLGSLGATITRMFHQQSAAARDRAASTALRSVAVLDVPPSTPAGGSRRAPRICSPLIAPRCDRGETSGFRGCRSSAAALGVPVRERPHCGRTRRATLMPKRV